MTAVHNQCPLTAAQPLLCCTRLHDYCPPLIYSGWRADGAVRTNFLVCYLLLPAPYRPFLQTTNMGASFHHQPPCFIPFLFVFIF